VAARAGVGKPTIYHRYPSKSDLVMGASNASTAIDTAIEGCTRMREL
jgi:AcrR family transcriptional regulator